MILKKSFLFLIIIFIFGFVRSDICDIVISEKNSITERKDDIFDHCSQHEDCSHFFGLDFRVKNRTLFERLTNSILSDFNNYYDPLIQICETNDPEEALRIIWPLMLISRRGENLPSCPLNHELRIKQDLSVECVCSAGANCSTNSTENDNFLIILLWIFAGVIIIIFLADFVKTVLRYIKMWKSGILWKTPPIYYNVNYNSPNFINNSLKPIVRPQQTISRPQNVFNRQKLLPYKQ